MTGEIFTKILIDDKDKAKLKEAGNTLYEVLSAFQKVGSYNDSEITTIRSTIGILDDIIGGEIF